MAIGNFTLDIERFVKKANGNIDLVVRKVALDIFKRVVMKTPVDEGRARGSWQCAIGSIPSAQVNYLDKDGAATIARIAAEVARAKSGDVIYCVSTLIYMRPLEYGHSKQAPNGMVRLTVSEWGAVINKAVSDLPE